jgi:hypothetical protein
MLRNFVQIVRSGVVGRKSLGTAPKRLVREWFEMRDVESIFTASIGQSPSFADILKMVHPKPADATREAFYGYLIGRAHTAEALPAIVRDYEAFKAGDSLNVPRVPFQMLTGLPLSTKEWTEIARTASWTMTRMNLNTFARHKVFEVEGMTELIARVCVMKNSSSGRAFFHTNCSRLTRRQEKTFRSRCVKRCRMRLRLRRKTCRRLQAKSSSSLTFPVRCTRL